VAGTFTATGSMTTARGAAAATLLDSGLALVTGGATNTTSYPSTTSADLYDPSAKMFAATVPMTAPRHDLTATLLPSGEVLVTGGNNAAGALASAELFDPDGGGSGGPDAGTDSGDSGTDAGPDSGMALTDSGVSGKDSSTASEDSGRVADGGQSASGSSSGCSCRTAQTRDGASYALLLLGAVGMVGVRRRQRRSRAHP
jgi:MYXO-CTERM domain-containing protein